MPNELFDGSTLFNSTASASSMRPAGTEGTAEDRHQSACSTGADPNRRSHQHRPDTAATGANHRDNGGQPAPPRLAVLDPIIQRGLQERQQQHHLDTGQVSKWKPDQMPDQTACQMPGQAPSHMLERQHAQGSTGQSSTPLTGQTEAPVGYASSVSRATPRLVSKAATTRLLQESESSEELLTLEELEERIASLNTTLLRVPSCTQQGSLSHGHERLAAYEQRQMQAAELPSRGVQASRLDGEAYQSSTSTSAITAWQKLTAKHQQPRASNPGLHDAEEDKGDLQSSGSSSPGCTVSAHSQ